MRVVLVCVAMTLLGGAAALNWNDVDLNASLDDLAERKTRHAISASRYDRSEGLRMLSDIPSSLTTDVRRLHELRLLSSLGRYRGVIRFIETSPRAFQERAFAEYVGVYLQACLHTGELERFYLHVTALRVVENERSRRTMLRGALALFTEERYDEARSFIEMFPPEMFPPHTWETLAAAAAYYTGDYREAHRRIDEGLGLGAATGRPALSQLQRAVLYDLKLLATSPDSLTDSDLMILSGAPLQSTRRNLIALALHRGLLDLAAARLEELPATDSTRVLAALLHNERDELPMADALLALTPDDFISRHRQAALLRSELDYAMGRYESAERSYKQYMRMETSPPLTKLEERYANYAIGWSFYGYYKFSNSAYWWIKNLDEPGLFDSLATIDLAALYTFTEHHDEARKYYHRMARRYPAALRGEVITAYLDNLRQTGRYNTLRKEFTRLYEEAPRSRRAEFARVLADVLYDREEWAAALEFYDLLPEKATDDESVWRRERCAYLSSEEQDIVAFLTQFINAYPGNPHAVSAALDLMRFYLETGQPELALAQPVSVTAPADTLAFLRARALAQLGETAAARDTLEALLFSDAETALRHRVIAELDGTYPCNDSECLTEISRKYDAIADSLGEGALREDLLLRMATRYESFSLTLEAVALYTALLQSPTLVDTTELRLRLARVLQMEKRYDFSLEVLAPLTEKDDDERRDEAFALEAAAVENLLDIIVGDEDESRRATALLTLAQHYERRDAPLTAWWFYGRAAKLQEVAEKILTEEIAFDLEMELEERYPGMFEPLRMRSLYNWISHCCGR